MLKRWALGVVEFPDETGFGLAESLQRIRFEAGSGISLRDGMAKTYAWIEE